MAQLRKDCAATGRCPDSLKYVVHVDETTAAVLDEQLSKTKTKDITSIRVYRPGDWKTWAWQSFQDHRDGKQLWHV